MMPLVYILVLNWNAYRHTISCVHSLLKLKYPNFKIVLIDNASGDNSEAFLRAEFPDIDFIQSGSNLGYAGGNNVGLRYALEHGADYIWILNNDTRVDPLALTALVEVMESNPEVGASGSKIYNMSDPKILEFTGGFIDFVRGTNTVRGYLCVDEGQYDQKECVEFLTGCSFLVRASVVHSVGLIIEDYFLYYEDVEWSWRICEAGFKLMYVPESKLWHQGGASSGGGASPDVLYYMTRNRLYFFGRYCRPFQRFTATVWYIYWCTRYMTSLFVKQRNHFSIRSRAILQAWWDYLGRRAGPRFQLRALR